MNLFGIVGVVLLVMMFSDNSYATEKCDFDCRGKKEDQLVALASKRHIQFRSISAPFPAGNVKFFLYNRDKVDDPEEYVVFSEPRDEVFYNLKPNRTTKIIIHGWLSYVPSLITDVMKDAYLPKYDYNLIMVDWSSAGSLMQYPWAKSHIPYVAQAVASFIDLLVSRHGIRPESLHLIGHSLGAHIAGVAARHITTGVVGRITGLDPAEPLLDKLNPEIVLSKDSAKYVDVIHTCGLYLGFMEPLGHADFYPNGGHFIQPGCGLDATGSCSHRRSYGYFAESIGNPQAFLAYPCNSWFLYFLNFCSNKSLVPMGEHMPIGIRGTYYLDTSSQDPFAQK